MNGKKWNGKGYSNLGNIVYELKDGNDYFRIFKNRLIFEGQYKNGEKNGKCKEYGSNGLLKFEGEYLNGKKWNGKVSNKLLKEEFELKNRKGYIKEYSSEGFQFEGDNLNRKSKEYDLEALVFEGQFLDGKRNGIGKEYNYGSLMFEGNYLNGKRNGKGKEYN